MSDEMHASTTICDLVTVTRPVQTRPDLAKELRTLQGAPSGYARLEVAGLPVGVTVARAMANVSLSTCAALPDPLPTYEPFSQEQLQGGAMSADTTEKFDGDFYWPSFETSTITVSTSPCEGPATRCPHKRPATTDAS